MAPLRSGPVSGPPVTGEWTRSELRLQLDHTTGGRWTGLRSGDHPWLTEDAPGLERLVVGDRDVSPPERAWRPAAALDRLGQPSGPPGWRVETDDAALSRTVHGLSGAVRIGYRVAAAAPWRHRVELPLRTAEGAAELHGDPAGLVEVSGWAHCWVVDGREALGLHWTTEQREDIALLGLATTSADGVHRVALGVGSTEVAVPARRDFGWRLVLTAWRS
ncbi:hypothetical protein DT076_11405 [Desertihabitans brevis]|uniref:Uncharacterized protein n=1 Tax=Desertihabitans brevis TaxID=2268447 RepID=A0A367YUD8_9ACTN|nr:hypothetical protein [Desertihabitans brevis]RCK69474.1 hypothetical protein DT076_11405 [Desertihabitans brevis]